MTTSFPAITLEKFTTFGDLLRFLRRRAGITQMELSIAVGYSDAQISRLEQNLRLPDIPTIEARFVPALGLDNEPKVVARLLDLAANVRREDAPALGHCPYKGLNYFDEADADLFVGREVLTTRLTARVLTLTSRELPHETRFLAVVGASGSGKSSLVRAGLIPALRWNKKSADWQIHILTPGAHPLESLAASLTQESSSVTATAALMDDLARDPRSLQLFAKRKLGSENMARLLLVVDQFEEAFALSRSEEETALFIECLLTAASESDGPILIVITLRADFYAHCANYIQLREALAQNQEYIGAMNDEEVRRAIEEPAQRGRWEFETGLVDLLLHDVGHEPGALPLLSHALLETWQRRRGPMLTLSGYASSGGVHGAIAETAETVFADQFTREQQAIARRIFLRLTALGDETSPADTRRRAKFDELILKPEEAAVTEAVLKSLADARLITTSEDSAEVAHEALIREWPTLRAWLEDNRDSLRLHRQLTEAAQEWLAMECSADVLYRGARLAQAREWASTYKDEMNAREREFLSASIQASEHEAAEREAQRQRELEAAQRLADTEKARAEDQAHSASRLRIRNRVITAIGSISLTLALLAGMFGIQSNNNAATAQSEAQARATQQKIAETSLTRAGVLRLAAEANKLLLQQGSDADLTALLSIRSINIEYTPQGDAALEGATTLAFPRRIFTGHTDQVIGSAFSPDGKYVLTGSLDKTVRLWEVETGQEVRKFIGPTGEVARVAFSPDGKYVAAAVFGEGTVRLWNTQTGEAEHVLRPPSPTRDVFFLPDGRHVITATWTPPALLWDIETGQVVREFFQAGQTDTNIYGTTLSRDGKYLLTGGKGGVAHLWDVQTGIELRQFHLPAPIVSLAFSPDDQYIASAGFDNIIRLVDRNTGQVVRTFVGHNFEIWSLSFSPDGKYILSGSKDLTARLWDAQSGDQIRILNTPPSDPLLPLGSVFSPDGRFIFTPSGETGRLWDTESVRNTGLPQFISPNDAVNDVAFSPDGKYIATANQNRVAKLWDVQTRRVIREFVGHTDYLVSLTFSPDGWYLLTGGGITDDTARLWDVQTGKELRRFAGSTNDNGINESGEYVAYSPDGEYIAVVGDKAILWDPQTGKQVRELVGHTLNIVQVTFSSDSRYLLTASEDGTARVWEVGTGKQIQLFNHEGLWSATFSPDGKYALTGGPDNLMHLWDIETGMELREYVGHTAIVIDVAFSNDGRYVLSTSDDGTARLWDFATGMEVRRFVGHAGFVVSGAFSPDDKNVLTGSVDGTARLWVIDYHDTIQYLCSRLTRDFTDEERKQYEINDSVPTCPKP